MKKRILSLVLVLVMAVMTGLAPIPITAQAAALIITSEGKEKQSFQGHTYQVFDESLTWQEAKNKCEMLGGHLATITSEDEQTFITQIISTGSKEYYWIGGNDEADEGQWVWVTGEPWNYEHWASGNPDNYNSENYLGILRIDKRWANNSGESCDWNDFSNKDAEFMGFVCEWDGEGFKLVGAETDKGKGRFQGHTYQIFDGVCESWQDAEGYCESIGGHLATITSQAENDFLYSYITEQGFECAYFGLENGSRDNTSWTWVTGEPFAFANWASGEPNASYEPYGMFYYKFTDGKWNDGDFGSRTERGGSAFICEWDAKTEDTPSSWAEEEVAFARDNGIVPSELDNNYTEDITRAEFCQVAVKTVDSLGMRNSVILIEPDIPGYQGTQFSDTSNQDVIDMANAGVVTGYGDGRFGPDDPITREQAAVMLTRLADKLGMDTQIDTLLIYIDAADIASWATDSVQFVSFCTTPNGKAVMGGTGNGYFSPKATYTREQAFISFGRLYEVVKAPPEESKTPADSGYIPTSLASWEDVDRGELELAKRGKQLVDRITSHSKSKANGVDTEKLAALKEQISVSWPCYHSYHAEAEVPDAVYEAFALAILDALDASNIEALETGSTKLTNQIYNSIKSGFSNDSVTVTVDGTAYQVDYNISGMSFLGIGAQVSSATVKWSNHEALLVSTSTSEDMKEALAAFCSTLAELNTEVWKEFMAAYVADAFGLMDISVTQKTVKEVLDKAEKVILALTDKDAADALLELAKDELSAEVQEQLKSGWLKNNFAEFIKENVPYGEQFIKGADLYKTAKEKYDKWAALVDTGVNGSDKEKAETLYNEFQSAMTDLDKALNAIP